MYLTFDKGRMVMAAVACLVGTLFGIVLLLLVVDFGADSVAASALRGGVIGGTVAGAAYCVIFAVLASNAGNPVVTIDRRGVEFHRPEVGLIPWSDIDSAGVERILGAKRLVVRVAPPGPKPGFASKLVYGLVAQKRDGKVRLMMPFGRFGADEAAVQAALDARGAQA